MNYCSILSTVFLLVGCATKSIPFAKGEQHELRSKKIVHVAIFPTDRPRVFIPAGVAGGTIATPLGKDESSAVDSLSGSRRDQSNGDPAGVLGHQFLAEIRSRKLVSSIPQVTDAEAPEKGLAMDFKTLTWTLHFPTPSSGYKLHYEARARLTEGGRSRPLWQGTCSHEVNEATVKKSWPDLIRNDGANLEKVMDSVVDTCTDQLVAQFQHTQF